MDQQTYDPDGTAADLAPGGEPSTAPLARRPGCATAYALLLGIAGTLHAGGILFATAVAFLIGESAGLPLGSMAIQLAVAALELLVARGVWRLRNWGRIAVIVLQGLGLLFLLLQLFGPLGGADPAFVLGAVLVGVAISGYIIYWFAAHGQYFD